jgi:uncharacterized protein YycO
MTPVAFRPGDVLLYSGKGLFSRLIQIKTWSRYSHVEVYDGSGFSVASRDRIGVGRYPLRMDGLQIVLRPTQRFHVTKARAWFRTVDGQPYDWMGLLAFTSARRQGQENWSQFCSEFATRFLRAGGVDPFNGYDADGIAPGEFLKSALLIRTWEAK